MTGDAPVRVLIADDTADIRLLLQVAMAERPDVEVVAEAVDGSQAVELAAALRPDLVVLDIAMPVLDGMSALPRLREAAPDSRVVVLSSLPAQGYGPSAIAAGATAFVEKSTSIRVLVDELLRAADLLDAVVTTLTRDATFAMAREPAELATARRLVTETLHEWQEPGLADTVCLLLTELLGNAIVHTSSDPDVTVRLLPDRVHVEVADTEPVVPHPTPASGTATSGRGLTLVDSLSMAWGSARIPKGKIVWFDVARP